MKVEILWLESALQDLEALSVKDIGLILRRVDLLSTFPFMGAPMLFDEWESYRQLICGNQRVITRSWRMARLSKSPIFVVPGSVYSVAKAAPLHRHVEGSAKA